MQKLKEIAANEIVLNTAKLLNFAKDFEHVSILQSNDYEDPYGQFECLAAFGANKIIPFQKDFLSAFAKGKNEDKTWWFGHLAYDLKNQIENLLELPKESEQIFENALFFEPKIMFAKRRGATNVEVYLSKESHLKYLDQYLSTADFLTPLKQFPKLYPVIEKQAYLDAVNRVKKEIQLGNVYELNYCQEFKTKVDGFSPYQAYLKLQKLSPMPFAAFYKQNESYLMSASPERYLLKKGDLIISQPIKGTSKRGANQEEDERLKSLLKLDPKEQNENVMIVDLVRNDLSRTATKNSVEVDELFGVYTFPQVHQLISTIKSKCDAKYDTLDVLKTTFPMGSMTGAPKISAMNIIEREEYSKRNLYSGTVGYISPNDDMDFNVIIRSLLYHSQKKILSLSVGGAITDLCDPEAEYQECLLKAKAIIEKHD